MISLKEEKVVLEINLKEELKEMDNHLLEEAEEVEEEEEVEEVEEVEEASEEEVGQQEEVVEWEGEVKEGEETEEEVVVDLTCQWEQIVIQKIENQVGSAQQQKKKNRKRNYCKNYRRKIKMIGFNNNLQDKLTKTMLKIQNKIFNILILNKIKL